MANNIVSAGPFFPSGRVKSASAITTTFAVYFAIISVTLLGIANLKTVEARYRHYCPHQIPPGSWKGICGQKLVVKVREICRMKAQIVARLEATATTTTTTESPQFNEMAIARNRSTSDASDLTISALSSSKRTFYNRMRRYAGSPEIVPEIKFERIPAKSTNKSKSKSLTAASDLIKNMIANANLLRMGGGKHLSSFRPNSISPSAWTPQNIICECCYNTCGVRELIEYCPD